MSPEDFLTLFLIRWPLQCLLRVTRHLLRIVNRTSADDYTERFFANHTTIRVVREGLPEHLSLRLYFNQVYEAALRADDASRQHLTALLRGCFVMLFVHDTRITRFVMADHSLHTRVFHSRPPSTAQAHEFMLYTTPLITAFCENDEACSILEMLHGATHHWLCIRMGQEETYNAITLREDHARQDVQVAPVTTTGVDGDE